MMALFWLLLVLAVVQGKHVKNLKRDDDLEWSERFHLKAIRSSLTSGIVENYEIWKTASASRIDYNGGVVKSIVKSDKHYKIRPVANAKQDVSYNCTILGETSSSFSSSEPETILPERVEFFYADGTELIENEECTKFLADYEDELENQLKQTVWAVSKDDTWVPVRYELIVYNKWLGSKSKHEVWDFYDYEQSFSLRSVFDISSYDCKNVSATDEMVTKHLLFIDPENNDHFNHVFNTFKNTHNKKYLSTKEHGKRKNIFQNNMRRIVEHNRQHHGYKLSINQYSDKTAEEITRKSEKRQNSTGTIPFPYSEKKIKELADELPEEYDARLFGRVTSVKTQEKCIAGWTFGPTAAVEGAVAVAKKGLVSLSNQAILDCAWPNGGLGCSGGTSEAAFEWIKEHGIPSEAYYGSYASVEGECAINKIKRAYYIKGYTVVNSTIEAVKVALVNHGPLNIQIDASNDDFVSYSSGIFYSTICSEDYYSHDATLVGYGEKNGETFWIIKNSFGQSWGIGGYMHISTRNNNCGVISKPTYAVL